MPNCRLRIYQGSSVIVDSGDRYDITISGGRVGLLTFNQSAPIWSDLIVRCVEKDNMALAFDGVDDNVFIGNVTDLGIDER